MISYHGSSSLHRSVLLRNHLLRTTRCSDMASALPSRSPTDTQMARFNASMVFQSGSPLIEEQYPNPSQVEKAAIVLYFMAMSSFAIGIPFLQFHDVQSNVQWLSENDRSGDLLNLILQCHEQQKYKVLLENPVFAPITPPTSPTSNSQISKPKERTPRRPASEVDAEVASELDKLRPLFLAVIEGQRTFRVWEPQNHTHWSEHIRSLGIPVVNGNPCMLIHNLGEAIDHEMNECLQQVLGRHPKMLTLLYDSPGRGKTRTILEGLCRVYGFYFVCLVSECIGSSDLQGALEDLHRSGRFTVRPRDSNGKYDEELVRQNEDVTIHRVHQVLLARLKIFKLFLEIIRPDGLAEDANHRLLPDRDGMRLWTMLQVAPKELLGWDCFRDLSGTYLTASSSYLEHHIDETAMWIRDRLPKDHDRQLFYVLDEAQYAAESHLGDFLSKDQKTPRPVLRQIVHALELARRMPFTLVISGTAFAKDAIEEALDSRDAKVSDHSVVHLEGDFSRSNVQWQYMRRYIPPAYLSSPSGIHLLERAHRWISGRYRFTATFLVALLHDGFQRPHRVLNAYVEHMTTYRLADARPQFINDEPADATHVNLQVREFDLAKFSHLSTDDPILQHLYTCVCKFLLDAKQSSVPSSLVQAGLAKALNGHYAYITENLPLLALANWLEQMHHTDFATYLEQNANEDGTRPYAFENIIPLYLTTVLNNQTPLHQIFKFFGTEPAWASETAVIVSSHIGDSPEEDVFAEVHYGSRDIPNAKLATRPKGPHASKQTIKWFKNPEGTAFLFPDQMCGPDCFALARLQNGQYIWIVMQMKCYSSAELSQSVLKSAITSVTPKHFCKGLKSRRTSSKNRIIRGMRRISHWEDRDSFRVLRVIAAYPAKANITHDRYPHSTIRHPLAELDIERLLKNDPSKHLRAIIASDIQPSIHKRPYDTDSETNEEGQSSEEADGDDNDDYEEGDEDDDEDEDDDNIDGPSVAVSSRTERVTGSSRPRLKRQRIGEVVVDGL